MTRTPERRPVKEAGVKDEHTPKLCECGCGEPAPIAKRTDSKRGYRKGEPIRFITRHNAGPGGNFRGRSRRPLDERYEIRACGFATPCWVWLLPLTRKGYALMHSPERKRRVSAHRYFYERFIGPIPEGLQIDHLCRVRHCVNPSHLEPVTNRENQMRGARAKLSDADRERVHGMRARGMTLREIGETFGVSESLIWLVVRRARQK